MMSISLSAIEDYWSTPSRWGTITGNVIFISRVSVWGWRVFVPDLVITISSAASVWFEPISDLIVPIDICLSKSRAIASFSYSLADIIEQYCSM